MCGALAGVCRRQLLAADGSADCVTDGARDLHHYSSAAVHHSTFRGRVQARACDVWALGVTVFWCVFGILPYEGETLQVSIGCAQ